MRTLTLFITLLLSACTSTPAPTPPPAPPPALAEPIPALRTTTPTLRTDTTRRHQQILTDAASGHHEILFLGASIIERWTTIGKDTWNSTWLPRHALNAGIGGDRTQHILARLDSGLLDALTAPNNDIHWIIINIGSNNLPDDTGQDLAAGIETILTRLHTKLPHAHIILSAVFPRGEHLGPMRDKAAKANQLLTTYITTHNPETTTLLDIGAHFLQPNGDLRADLMPDYLHPTAPGYTFWTSELEKIIK